MIDFVEALGFLVALALFYLPWAALGAVAFNVIAFGCIAAAVAHFVPPDKEAP